MNLFAQLSAASKHKRPPADMTAKTAGYEARGKRIMAKTEARWEAALADGPKTTRELKHMLGYTSIYQQIGKMQRRGLIVCIGEVQIDNVKVKVWKWKGKRPLGAGA